MNQKQNPKRKTLYAVLLLSILLSFPKNIFSQTSEQIFNQQPEISADAIDRQIAIINQRLQDKKINDALKLTLDLKSKAPYDIKVRELLFEIYIAKKLLKLAEQELIFLENNSQSSETLYRRARLLQLQNKRKESRELVDQLLEQYEDFADTHLLLANLLREEKLFREARIQLEIYEGRVGRNASFLLSSALIEADREEHVGIRSSEVMKQALVRMRNNLDEYSKKFDANNSDYYTIKTRYLFLVRDYQAALEEVERAIFFDELNEDLRKQKVAILYFKKDIQALISYIEQLPTWNEKVDQKNHLYLLGYLHFYKEKTQGDDWKVPDNTYLLRKILPPLLKAYQLETEDELIQFFIESLLLANLELTHPLRERFSQIHLKRAMSSLKAGEKTQARYSFLRAINLSPQDVSVRKDYSKFLKNEKLFTALLEEMYILQNLMGEDFTSDYKWQTQLELLEKQEKQKTLQRENIKVEDIANEERTRILLLYENVSWQQQWPFPYREIITRDLLLEKFNYSHIFRTTVDLADRLEGALALASYDYYLKFQSTDENEALNFSLNVFDATSRQQVFTDDASFSGNHRYLKAVNTLSKSFNDFLPIKGQILKIDGYKIILSFGEIHGVKKEDRFQIETKDGWIQDFPLIEINERVSIGEVRDFLLLPKIKLNDRVLITKKKDQP